MSEEKEIRPEGSPLGGKLENPEIFINRKEEKQYFLDYFNNVPRNILFVYWPKSTGKTTLIYKIINEELDKEKFDVNFMNLRSVLIRNFNDFRNLFFPESLKNKTKKQLKKWFDIDIEVKIC